MLFARCVEDSFVPKNSSVLKRRTGHIGQQGSFISITEGNPWTKGTGSFGPEGIDITWSYANGILHLSDGTPNLDMDFVVGVGGRILTFVGLGDDGEAVLVIATRLQ